MESGPTSSVSLVHQDSLVKTEFVDDFRAAVLTGLHQGSLQVSVCQVDFDVGESRRRSSSFASFISTAWNSPEK